MLVLVLIPVHEYITAQLQSITDAHGFMDGGWLLLLLLYVQLLIQHSKHRASINRLIEKYGIKDGS